MLLPSNKRRADLEDWLETVLTAWFAERVLTVDRAIAERWGQLTAEAKLKGTPVAVIDGLLPATAAERHLTVVTRNERHFSATGAPVFNPWE